MCISPIAKFLKYFSPELLLISIRWTLRNHTNYDLLPPKDSTARTTALGYSSTHCTFAKNFYLGFHTPRMAQKK